MAVKPENTEESPRQGAIGPGERLQAARIKKGLSVDDVASRMHLSISILEAIEENNFDEITAPIFVKGYLRAYARIVALSEDEMIQQYIDFYSEEDPPISSTSNMVPELSVADARIKWTTYLVVVVLAVLLAAWWWNKQQNEEAPISLDTQSPQVEETVDTDQSSDQSNDQPSVDSDIQAGSENNDDTTTVAPAIEPATSVESVEAEASVEASNEDAAMEAEAIVEEAVAEEAIAEEAVVDSADTVATVEPVDTEAVSVNTQDSGTASDSAAPELVSGTREFPTRVAPSGSDRLKILVHADTWADVKDANSHQLVYDLLRADTRVDLSGEAPFAVFLGNGHGVEILLNDTEVSFAPKIRDDNTARLDIGG